MKSIVFLGGIISSERIKVDQAKIEQFLGMITHLGKFIPNLAEVTSPLRTLLKKEVELKLEKSQLNPTGKLKLLVTTTPCLILNF